MKIVCIIIGLIGLMALFLVVKTWRMKPTLAKTVKVELDNGPRVDVYGEKLSRMIRHETVSCRDKEDFINCWKNYFRMCIVCARNMFLMEVCFLNGPAKVSMTPYF